MDEVRVVVAHSERATLRVGNVFLKVDADQTRIDVEVEAMALAPIPTPEVLWRKPPVLAIAAVPGRALGRLGAPSTASPAAWAAAGAAIRKLLDDVDRDLIASLRRTKFHQLGFALQMCPVRYVGLFLEDPLAAPWPVVEHLAVQLGIDDPFVCEAVHRAAEGGVRACVGDPRRLRLPPVRRGHRPPVPAQAPKSQRPGPLQPHPLHPGLRPAARCATRMQSNLTTMRTGRSEQ
ncbi:DUF4158 domain-containing protein [Streptomyces sp. NPDC057291]|uniref:DUF4158 domain-containing protein n=1 Tax=Streptomyces sp. NPDC057291 TaxID=3346087 RepID=UPI003632DA93